ncbi:MAG: recombinase family protein [Bacteroidota bacterium]|nr:recombinase family protein [Bacteroidota bacterium]
MKAAVYSRKSKFTGKGESIENQIQLCKEYGQTNLRITDFTIYEDEGFSGGNTDRPQFQKMLKDAKAKKFDALICYRLDRISRNIADFSLLIGELEDLGINFVSIREQFDTSTPLGRAMMYISSVFAQLERETIAERIRDNMMQLARSGRWLGGVTPTGYISEPIDYYDEHMNKKNMYRLVEVPQEIETVKIIFDKYLEFDSLSKLDSYCLVNNIKSKKGNNFDNTSLAAILTNPVYATADDRMYQYCLSKKMDVSSPEKEFNGKHGLMVFNKSYYNKKNTRILKDYSEWVVAVGKHKGVIPSDQWIKANNMYEHNKTKAPRTGTSEVALLTPMIKCAVCGTPMRISYKPSRYKGDAKMFNHYYMCRLKERSKRTQCNVKNMNGKLGEQVVIDQLKQLAVSKRTLEKQLDIKKKLAEKSNNKKTDKKQIESKIKDLEKAIENLTMQLASNSSSTAAMYIIKQIEKLDNELKELRVKRDTIEEQNEHDMLHMLNIDILFSELQDFRENFDTWSFEKKKRSINNLVKELTWDGEKIKITLREPKY